MYENLLRQRECKVCLVNLATVCFLPCRHLSVCPACAPQLQVLTDAFFRLKLTIETFSCLKCNENVATL